MGNPIYAGSLVSQAGDATALIVHFLDITDREFIRSGLHADIRAIVEEEKGDNTAWLTGAPHFKVAIIEILIHDLVWTPPLIALILAIVLVLFGAKRLRNVGSDLGSAVKGFKKAVSEEEEKADTEKLEKREGETIQGEATKVKEEDKT